MNHNLWCMNILFLQLRKYQSSIALNCDLWFMNILFLQLNKCQISIALNRNLWFMNILFLFFSEEKIPVFVIHLNKKTSFTIQYDD